MLLGIINAAIDLLFGIPFEPSWFYLYLLPYVVFLLLRVRTNYLYVGFIIITIAISYSVLDNFIETLKGPEGIQNVFNYNTRLRPDTFEAMSRTGDFYRPAGYTGSYHDSANILGMVSCLFFMRFLVRRKWLDLGLALFALTSLTLTQSAINIFIAIFTCVIFSIYVLVLRRKIRTLISFLLIMIALAWLVVNFGDVITIFTKRLDAVGEGGGMLYKLDMSSLMSSVPFFFIGHASAFGSEIIHTEIGHLKLLFQLGIVHTLILYWILFYPILRFKKVRSFCFDSLPGVAALFFGIMSMLHYGSLFRSTNILLFYAIYATCLTYIFKCKRSMRISERESIELGLDGRSPSRQGISQ
jgi:hypothetical protein